MRKVKGSHCGKCGLTRRGSWLKSNPRIGAHGVCWDCYDAAVKDFVTAAYASDRAKECSDCREQKPLRCYAFHGRTEDAFRNRCEQCIYGYPREHHIGPNRLNAQAVTNAYPFVRGRSYTYFVQQVVGGPVKIGRAGYVPSRIGGLQTSHFEELVLLGATLDHSEDDLHARFAAHRIRGEWFDCAPPLVSFLRSLGFEPSTAQPSRVELIAA